VAAPVQAPPHPLRDTRRPPPGTPPTRLRHHLPETATHGILKRSVMPCSLSTTRRPASSTATPSCAGRASGRSSNVAQRSLPRPSHPAVGSDFPLGRSLPRPTAVDQRKHRSSEAVSPVSGSRRVPRVVRSTACPRLTHCVGVRPAAVR
jgi:hypothetical protein